jgi:tetratricopeptide (TPR) repeat protein
LEAVRLMDQGKFAEAAALLDGLAGGAEEKGMLARAGQLNLQAARAYLQLDNLDSAYERAKKGLFLLQRAGRGTRVMALAPRVLQALEERGRHAQAEELKRELAKIGPAARPPGPMGLAAHMAGEVAIVKELPEKCPHCSAPMREDEVDWLGAGSVECPYCGGSVKVELRRT